MSNGVQDYETNKSLYPLTQPIPKIEALAQTSGQAEYINDIPDLPGQLHLAFVEAKAAPKSKIKSVSAANALVRRNIISIRKKF